jgi:hypothetical protein
LSGEILVEEIIPHPMDSQPMRQRLGALVTIFPDAKWGWCCPKMDQLRKFLH